MHPFILCQFSNSVLQEGWSLSQLPLGKKQGKGTLKSEYPERTSPIQPENILQTVFFVKARLLICCQLEDSYNSLLFWTNYSNKPNMLNWNFKYILVFQFK